MSTDDLNRYVSDISSAIVERRAVLFLGAGASLGATDDPGNEIPDSQQLADQISGKLLGPEYVGDGFPAVYDLACNARGVREVQEEIRTILYPFNPAPHHFKISEFPWAGIVTTNYDLVVERAFEKAPGNHDSLKVMRSDKDHAADHLGKGLLLYIKMHGCIGCYQETNPPLVGSTEQLIASRDGREGQFTTFLEWAKSKTIIFVGYRFLDSNLRQLYREIIADGENHPPHFMVDPGLRTLEQDYWRDRRVRPLVITFEDFLNRLDQAIPENNRQLSRIVDDVDRTGFTKFISTQKGTESNSLTNYFATSGEVVNSISVAVDSSATDFYRGVDCGWDAISEDWDVRRRVIDTVLEEQILPVGFELSPRLVMLLGHAGSGRTIILRRLAWETANEHDKLAIFVSNLGEVNIEAFEEIFGLTNVPVFLFVDDVSDHISTLSTLMERARKKKWKLLVIGSERSNTWNVKCDVIESYVENIYEIHRLSEADIRLLLEKLDASNSLGELKQLEPAERFDRFKKVYDRQLLVALHEATHGKDFRDIIADEYSGLHPEAAKFLYLDICSLHRLGKPVRAGLISRVHDIVFEDFEEKFFAPLEQVVVRKFDPRSGDYIFESRHPFIAQIVYEAVLIAPNEIFDNLLRILRKLNPAYSYDLSIVSDLISADNIIASVPDYQKARSIYEIVLESVGEVAFVYQQWAIFESRSATNVASVNTAEELATRALDIEPYNPSVRHTLAEIALKRSRLVTDPAERAAFRRRAISQAKNLTNKARTSHSHHTIAKAETDAVREALDALESSGDETAQRSLEEAVKRAEAAIREGKDRFPDDSHLLGAEAELASLLRDSDRALRAMEKAFSNSPQSELVVKRLATLYQLRGQYDQVIDALKVGLEHNPGSLDLHYDYARALALSSPELDFETGELQLFHLKRSFTPNDRRYDRQFWYARQLCLHNRFEEAQPIFEHLKKGSLPFHVKQKVRGYVKDESGNFDSFAGTIKKLSASFGFIRSESPLMDVYFDLDEDIGVEGLREGQRVSFSLGFTMIGPIAKDLQLSLDVI